MNIGCVCKKCAAGSCYSFSTDTGMKLKEYFTGGSERELFEKVMHESCGDRKLQLSAD